MIKEIVNRSLEIMKVYSDLQRAVDLYKAKAGIDCIDGCGHCCNNPDVEASPGEFLPLALKLWETGAAMKLLAKIYELPENSVCVLYASDPGEPESGHCSVYNYRGMICRLFGFTGAMNKKGENALITCGLIKKNKSLELQNAGLSGILPPLIEEYTRVFDPLITEFGTSKYPINHAIRIMVEKIGFLITLLNSEKGINY